MCRVVRDSPRSEHRDCVYSEHRFIPWSRSALGPPQPLYSRNVKRSSQVSHNATGETTAVRTSGLCLKTNVDFK